MQQLVFLLRAVNVGGTGKLPMAELRAMAEACGLREARTYIASGNLVAGVDGAPEAARAALEARIADYAGKPVSVLMRTGEEMAVVLADNPFPEADPRRLLAVFLDAPPPQDALESVTGRTSEEIALGRREIYVNYGDAMTGRSTLKIPATAAGTARNMNTVAKLAEMACRT